MKSTFLNEIKALFEQSKTWLKFEVEYAKLTLAEKVTLLLGTLIIGFVCLLLLSVVCIILSLSLAEVFKLMMAPALAYLCSAGVFLVITIILYLLRKPLLLNPIARLVTRVFFEKKHR